MRGFDFEIILKNGMNTVFSGADKKELDNITDYFRRGGVTVKTINEMNNLDEELGRSDEEDNSIVTRDREREDEMDDDFVAPDGDKGEDEDWGSEDDAVDEE